MEKVVLYDFKADKMTTNVVAFFETDGSLRIDGCDTGDLVKEFWGDFDYEYIITVKPADLPLLQTVLDVPRSDLLSGIRRQFEGPRAFSNFKTFLDANGIAYDFFTWA